MNSPRMRRGVLALFDMVAWLVATALVLGVRHDFNINEVQWESVLNYWLQSSVLLVLVGYLTKFYRGRFLVGSFDEAFGLAIHVGLVGLITLVTFPFINETLPRSIPVLVPPIALLISAAGRWFYRALRDRPAGNRPEVLRNAIVYGAGDAGRQVANLVRTDPDLSFRIIGFVDDNPGKRYLKISGIPVLGDGSSLVKVAAQNDVSVVIFAVPSAPGALIGRVQEMAQDASLEFFVLPRVTELIGGRVEAADIRPVEISDVLDGIRCRRV